MWMKEMRSELGLEVKEVVPVIRNVAPKYDGPLHSKVERPESYGIELKKSAVRAVCKHFCYEPSKQRTNEKRTKPYRIQGRLEKTEFDRLQIAIREDGYETMQDFIYELVFQYLEARGEKMKGESL